MVEVVGEVDLLLVEVVVFHLPAVLQFDLKSYKHAMTVMSWRMNKSFVSRETEIRCED